MTDCAACIASGNFWAPCPHAAEAAVKRYGQEQYLAGLRVGLDRLFELLAVVDGHQERGARSRPIPLAVIRSSLRGRLARLLDAAAAVDREQAELWKAEAREALDAKGTA